MKLENVINLSSSTKRSIIFIVYVFLYVNQGILMKMAQIHNNNNYNYNITQIVFIIECLKLLISIVLYLKTNKSKNLFFDLYEYRNVFYLYFIPAILYCIYNNLSFINLINFDPTTYFLLLQLRVVFTGLIFQIIFAEKLNQKKWISLILLTIGCMIKEFPLDITNSYSKSFEQMASNILLSYSNYIMLFVQIICSSFAGIYNEYLIKKSDQNIDIYLHNVFMYINSIICNLIIILIINNFSQIQNGHQIIVFCVILNNTIAGIVTSYFLKYLNSILKIFANSLEIILSAIICYFFFSIPITFTTVLSIVIVILAMYMYASSSS